ncbi:MAG: hypothetical protein N2691_03800 [Patescibacteria group bacterium]|nr:hypothetical protein [Patescibacteria group bacterium]
MKIILRRFTILTICFVFCIILNLTIAGQLNAISVRDRRIHVILDELESFAANPVIPPRDAVNAVKDEEPKDPRIAYLKSFMRKYDSELYEHAPFIVETADKYGIDYRLLPAIAMQESNLCRVIPHGSHNCWGWGIYGGKVTRFESYPQAIEAVTKGLKEYYVDQGLTTPDQIMKKYNPSSNGSWARGVNFFLERIE